MEYYNWPEVIAKLSNNELLIIIKNKSSEPEEKVNAAVNEMKKRGFDENNYSQVPLNEPEVKALPDENSPVLFSNKVIYTFSILFTVIFGGILFAMNLKTLNNKKGIAPVIIFSVLYTALALVVLNLVDLGSAGALLAGALGAVIINTLFWNKYIGKETVYNRRSYKIPLIIALSIFIPFTALLIWMMILAGQV